MRFFNRKQDLRLRKNEQIKAVEVRVIDEAGKNLGVLDIETALSLAKKAGLDLIEITAKANPPVAKIISFDKFRYQKEKEEKKQKKSRESQELKQIRITPRAALHDLQLKIKQTNSFLQKGHRVEINLFLKGREKAHPDFGLKKLNGFLGMLETPYQITSEVKKTGRGFNVQILKK